MSQAKGVLRAVETRPAADRTFTDRAPHVPARGPKKLHFRRKPGIAVVFRPEENPIQKRVDLVRVARVKLSDGEVTPMPNRKVSDEEREIIADWLIGVRQSEENVGLVEARRLMDRINEVANWVEQAPIDHVEEVHLELLMAMHDLKAQLTQRRGAKS